MKKIIIMSILMCMVWGLSACGSGTATATVSETVPAEFVGQTNPYGAEVAAQGAELYKSYCASCHGETGLGDGPASASLVPAPKNLAELQAVAEDDYLFWRIHAGKDGTAMIGWQGILSDEQIWQIVAFLRTLQ